MGQNSTRNQSVPNLLLKGCLLAVALTATLFVAYKRVTRHNQSSYLAAIIDKHHRADSLQKGPRILLTGGSATAFGLNSQLLEDGLSYPVVNLALHAGLGLPFMLKQVQTVARPGDIVVLTPEYYLSAGDDYTQFYVSELFAPATQYMTFDGPIDHIARRTLFYLKCIRNSIVLDIENMDAALVSDTKSVYFRAGFSRQGDLVSALNNPRAGNFPNLGIVTHDYQQELNLIDTVASQLRRKNISVFITFPALSKSQFIAGKAAIDRYEDQIRRLTYTTAIGTPASVVYPDSGFFDSHYHLHTQYRELHSRQVLADLSTVLAASKAQPSFLALRPVNPH